MHFVPGHDHVGHAADGEVFRPDAHAALTQCFDFFHRYDRVESYAVADNVHRIFVENAARDKVQGEPLASDGNGMSRVGSATVSRDVVASRGQGVDNFALALVAPLQAYNCNIFIFHGFL